MKVEKLETFALLEIRLFKFSIRTTGTGLVHKHLRVCATSTARASSAAEHLWHDFNLINE